MILITLFYISLFGIITLFSLKAWESKQGKVYAADLRERSDIAVERAILRCVREYRRHDKERLSALARKGFTHLRAWFLIGKSSAESYWKKILTIVQGRRERSRATRSHAAPVSFFLKQISDYKNGNGHLKSEKKPEQEPPVA